MEPVIKNKKLYKELRKKHVTMLNPVTTYISSEAEFEPTITIHSGVKIIGRTKICSFSAIGVNSIIRNSKIGRGVLIKENCVIENSIIENLCEIGPFAHLRPGTIIKNGAVIGKPEIKNSVIGKNTKILHFAYIGDAKIGENVTIGAGTVTCNYDGEKKHKTIIEDNVFVGSGVELVAPVKIGKNAYIAAGSTITKDVPPETLAIARARQIDKINWVKDKKDYKKGSNK